MTGGFFRSSPGGGWRPPDTLADARARVQANLREGSVCPCCDQLAKQYRRRLNKGQAESLKAIYKHGNGSERLPVYIPSVPEAAKSREEGKMAMAYGFLEETHPPHDDGNRAGWWRITVKGEQFVLGKIRVPMYAYFYNQGFYGLDGDEISIHDCVSFKKNKLMDGE
jgi:hypothetical protein